MGRRLPRTPSKSVPLRYELACRAFQVSRIAAPVVENSKLCLFWRALSLCWFSHGRLGLTRHFSMHDARTGGVDNLQCQMVTSPQSNRGRAQDNRGNRPRMSAEGAVNGKSKTSRASDPPLSPATGSLYHLRSESEDLRMPADPIHTAARADPTRWPNYQEGDFVIRNYVFRSGETLPGLKLHYRTLGTPKRNTAGNIGNG